MDVVGRVVAVTGGGRGIGLAIATAFARAGARVAIGDLDGPVAAAAAAGLGCLGASLDVRDEASYAAFLDLVARQLGPLDVLVGNAGVAVPGPLLATTAAEQDLQLEVNLHGVVRGFRLALPGMVARGHGHVVTVASAAGRIPSPGAAVYGATKHGVVALSDAVRSELRGSGVRITSVLPAVVRTEMAAGLRMRGLPAVEPAVVAGTVVRVVARRRPPASVMVPRWMRAAAMVDAVSPQWLRDLARRVAVVTPPADRGVRAAYDERIARQLDEGPPDR